MAVRIAEVDPTASVGRVDPTCLLPAGIGPVVDPGLGDPAEDLVELLFGDEERIVLRLDRVVRFVEVERHAVGGRGDQKRSKSHGCR